MLEKQGVQTVADRRFIWNIDQIAEERDASNTVLKRFYEDGVQILLGVQAGSYYYQKDLLGSIWSVQDSAGAVVASYDFDLWGKRTKLSGNFSADFGFTGYFQHEPSGLALALFRGYSPLLGRWVNRDPIEENGGVNLYAYVGNDPMNWIDPFGLCMSPSERMALGAKGVAQTAGGGIAAAGGIVTVGSSAGPWAPATAVGGSIVFGFGMAQATNGLAKIHDAIRGEETSIKLDDPQKTALGNVGKALAGDKGKKFGEAASDALDVRKSVHNATGPDASIWKRILAALKLAKKVDSMNSPSNQSTGTSCAPGTK